MSSKFYASVISENEHGIEISALKQAAKDISRYYSNSSLKEGSEPPDYNNPAYRCAYLHKYASLHTGMAKKYFQKMLRKKEARNILYRNSKIKICCLGGGPGTEIVGIFKALANVPTFHERVSKVSVLDVCKGWENSFKSIITNLIKGKNKLVPGTFVNRSTFKKEFIQVDLQDQLPENVRKVISEADVICMMKFVSELSTERSAHVLKVLGELFQNKALVLYIDNCSSESIDFTSISPEFKVVLGPLDDEKFVQQASNSNIGTYGCNPHTYGRISVIGWIKTFKIIHGHDTSSLASYSSLTDVGTIETESEIEDCDSLTIDEEWGDIVCDKYTQTEEDSSFKNEIFQSPVEVELAALMEALAHLLTVLEKFTL